MSQDDPTFELTRRKALAGLGTIGVASAGAGLGTSAYFNDTESFDGNTMTAGTLNLELSGGVVYTNRTDGSAPSVNPGGVTNDGDLTAIVDFDDVKPGDCYVIHTDEIIEGNPAYLEMSLEETADNENDYEEPEPTSSAEGDTDDPNDADGGGELDDRMEVSVWYGGTDTTGRLVSPADVTCQNIDEKSPRSNPLTGPQTLQDAFDGLAEDDDPTDGDAGITPELVPGGTDDPLELDPGTWRKYWVFHLPTDVGNEVQGDSVTFNINASIEQARNNDSPFQNNS